MKRWILISLLSLSLSSAAALPIRNPVESDTLDCGLISGWKTLCSPISFRLGFESDYVFECPLQKSTPPTSRVDQTTLQNQAAYLVLNVFNKIDFFTTLGANLITFKTTVSPFGPSPGFTTGNLVELQTATDLSCSFGLRGILYEFCGIVLGMEGEYFYTRPKVNSITIDSNTSDYPNHVHCRYQEWQIGMGTAYCIANRLYPYIAAKWSGARADFNHYVTSFDIHLNSLKNARCFGYAVGFSTHISSLLFSLEWRLQNEKALFLSAQTRY